MIYGPNTSTTRELIALAVQDNLREIGIDVEIQALEWASFLEATDAEEPDWDMFIGGWRATIEPHIMYTIWAAENIPELNSVAYDNPEVEALFDEAGKSYDTDFRREKYQEIQSIISEDAPYVFLFYSEGVERTEQPCPGHRADSPWALAGTLKTGSFRKIRDNSM